MTLLTQVPKENATFRKDQLWCLQPISNNASLPYLACVSSINFEVDNFYLKQYLALSLSLAHS